MAFEWDEAKSEANRQRRGFDFDFAARIHRPGIRQAHHFGAAIEFERATKMAIVRKSLSEILAEPPRVDHAKIAATTEDDIRRHQIEDGEDPDAPLGDFQENFVGQARYKLGVTLDELADITQIPVASLRDWEELRSAPDPAAKSLLKIIWLRPEETKAALLEAKRKPAA